MTPFDPTDPDPELDVGLGLDIDVEVDARGTDQEDAPANTRDVAASGEASPPDDPTMSYLVQFDPDVTPDQAEAVLGRLSPPDEGIILAGSGAVIVNAHREFVESAKQADCVALVNAVHTQQWEPNRHRVRKNPD